MFKGDFKAPESQVPNLDQHISLCLPQNVLAYGPNLTPPPRPTPGRGVILGATGPLKFWQKWEVFMALGERTKQMEYAVRLEYMPCQMQPFIGEVGGKGVLSLSLRPALWNPVPQGHISISPGASPLHGLQREPLWNSSFSLFAPRTRADPFDVTSNLRQGS